MAETLVDVTVEKLRLRRKKDPWACISNMQVYVKDNEWLQTGICANVPYSKIDKYL